MTGVRLGLLLASMLVAGPAAAEEPAPTSADAGALLRRAIDEIGQARFRQALDLLERAERVADDPKTQGQVQLYLGITSAVLGDGWRARGHFRAALTLDPELSLDPGRIKADVVRLLEEVRRGLKGTLIVRLPSDRPTTVLIDGTPAPRKVSLPVGAHRLEVRGHGGRSLHTERVVIGVGAVTTVRVAAPGDPEPAPRPRRGRRVWTWVALGTAGAAAIAAVAVYGAGTVDEDELWQEKTGPARGEELKASLRHKQDAIYGLLGASGALFATAALLYYFEGRAVERRGVTLTAGPTGVSLTWRH